MINCEELQSVEGAYSWIQRFKSENVPQELILTFDELVKTEPPENNEECGLAYVTLIETFADWFLQQHLYDREYVLAIQSAVSAAADGGYCTKFKETMENLWFEEPMNPLYTLHRWILCPQVCLGLVERIGRGESFGRHLSFDFHDVLRTLFSSQMGHGDRIERLNDMWDYLRLHTYESDELLYIVSDFIQASGLALEDVAKTFDNGSLFIGSKRVCTGSERIRQYAFTDWLCGSSLETILLSGRFWSASSSQKWEQYKYPEMIEWALNPDNAEHRDEAIAKLAVRIHRSDGDGLGSIPLLEFKSSRRNLDLLCNHLKDHWVEAAEEFLLLICQFPKVATCHNIDTLLRKFEYWSSELVDYHSETLPSSLDPKII